MKVVKVIRNKYINTVRVFVRSDYTGIVAHFDFKSAKAYLLWRKAQA